MKKNIKMKKTIIFLVLVFLLIQGVSAGFNYKVEMHYNNGEVSIENINVEFSHYKPVNYFNKQYPSYVIKTNSFSENFSIGLLQSTDIYDNQTGLMSRGEVKRINESYFIIEIPYDSSEKEIQITDLNGNVIAKKSVIEFSRNFNYDEYKEDSVKNKSDSDNIDANGACKDNCIEISNINKNKNLSIITIIILIVVLIGLFYYLFKSLAKGKK